ncbi:MAG: hypothetical protein JSW39_20385, partial [Desulfobacterales bacterium]
CIDIFWREHVDFRREDVFSEEKADTHIMVLPDGHDPDSFLAKYGPASFRKEAARAPGIISFLTECAIKKHGLSIEGRIRVISDLQGALATINDPVARSLYVNLLSERLNVPEAAVLERVRAAARATLKKDRGKPAVYAPADESESWRASGSQETLDTSSRLERQVLTMMLQFPEILPEINRHRVVDHMENSILKSIGETILGFDFTSADRVSELLNSIEDPEKRRLVAAMAMGNEAWNRRGCLRLITKFVETRQKKRQQLLIEEQIRAAEKKNDQTLLLRLLNEKQKMAIRSERQKMTLLHGK